MSSLRLHGISKSYGPLEVLSPTDLTVNQGEFITLLGPSGSGKTTLLQIIAGIVEPTKGTIQIGGLDATRVHSRDRQLAMVFQNYALVPHMSVFENVAFPLKIRKHSAAEIREKVRTALASVRLEQYADRKPRQLSGGQQQRVAIARALVYNPSLVLMDEPLGALDKNLRDQLQEEISKLHRTLGVTIIYVTHDQQEAMAMSDRVVLMQQGRIEQAAPPAELYHRPRTAFAARFLGESNLLSGKVFGNQGGLAVRLDSGEIVRAPTDSQLSPGQDVTILVRPEQMQALGDGKAVPEGANIIDVSREGRTFLGAVTRHHFRTRSGQEIRMNTPSSALESGGGGGAESKLVWRPEQSVVLEVAR